MFLSNQQVYVLNYGWTALSAIQEGDIILCVKALDDGEIHTLFAPVVDNCYKPDIQHESVYKVTYGDFYEVFMDAESSVVVIDNDSNGVPITIKPYALPHAYRNAEKRFKPVLTAIKQPFHPSLYKQTVDSVSSLKTILGVFDDYVCNNVDSNTCTFETRIDSDLADYFLYLYKKNQSHFKSHPEYDENTKTYSFSVDWLGANQIYQIKNHTWITDKGTTECEALVEAYLKLRNEFLYFIENEDIADNLHLAAHLSGYYVAGDDAFYSLPNIIPAYKIPEDSFEVSELSDDEKKGLRLVSLTIPSEFDGCMMRSQSGKISIQFLNQQKQ